MTEIFHFPHSPIQSLGCTQGLFFFPFHLAANHPRAASADARVELHAGLFQAGLTLLPEGHHGLIAHLLGRLQFHFSILSIS